MTTKTCTKCSTSKDISKFAKQAKGKHGVTSVCKECKREYNRDHYAPGSEAHTNKLQYLRDYRQQVKEQVFAHYGKQCACCGEDEPIFLTLDHMNNDGADHRRELLPGTPRGASADAVWRWVVKNDFPDTFQILCFNCNCGKQANGVCPHQAKD